MYNHASRLMLSVHTLCTATSIPGFLQPRASRNKFMLLTGTRSVDDVSLGRSDKPKTDCGMTIQRRCIRIFHFNPERLGILTAGYCRFVIYGHHMDTGEFVETSRVTACAGVALWHGGFISWQACRLGPLTCCISRVDWNIIGIIFELDYINII